MNLLGFLRRLARPRVPNHILLYSSKAQIKRRPAASPSVLRPIRKRLFVEILQAGSLSSSVTEILDKWVKRGHSIDGFFLTGIVKALRKHRRFTHALQILEWMTKDGNRELTSSHLAIRLDLIAKVRDLKDAEKYFEDIPEALRCSQVYGSLLNCYAYKNSLEKAEFILQKMRELGFTTTLLPYNSLLTAYSRAGKFAEMDLLLKEMEDKASNGTIIHTTSV